MSWTEEQDPWRPEGSDDPAPGEAEALWGDESLPMSERIEAFRRVHPVHSAQLTREAEFEAVAAEHSRCLSIIGIFIDLETGQPRSSVPVGLRSLVWRFKDPTATQESVLLELNDAIDAGARRRRGGTP